MFALPCSCVWLPATDLASVPSCKHCFCSYSCVLLVTLFATCVSLIRRRNRFALSLWSLWLHGEWLNGPGMSVHCSCFSGCIVMPSQPAMFDEAKLQHHSGHTCGGRLNSEHQRKCFTIEGSPSSQDSGQAPAHYAAQSASVVARCCDVRFTSFFLASLAFITRQLNILRALCWYCCHGHCLISAP